MLAPEALTAAYPRDWRVRDVVLGFALVPVAFIAIVGIVMALGMVTADGALNPTAAVLSTLAFELALAGIVLLLAARRGLSAAGLGLVWPRRWGPLFAAWLGSHAIIVVYTLLVMGLGSLGVDVERFEGGNSLPISPDSSGGMLVLLGITAVLAAPVCEELFFRGFLYRAFRGFWSVLPALALSGLLFGLFHLNLGVVIPFVLVGALFAWSTEASGSLLTSIGAHMLVNGLAFAAAVAGVE